MTQDLETRINEIARAAVLLIASDYDGTLAPIVSDPGAAHPDRESLVALRQLADLAQTHVAIISGRALCDLAELTGSPDEVHLVGSHGSEFDPDFAVRLPPETIALRDRIADDLAEIAARGNGFRIESKPASIAFHFRDVEDSIADDVVRDVLAGPGSYDGVFTKHGKKVVELGVVSTSKGEALERIRRRVGATAAIFIGDDVTDEDAFATLRGPDIGVKVGFGETQASFRVEDTHEVARLLARLAEARSAWLAGDDAVPIEHLSMLSDQRTAVIVGPDASVLWMCLPRIDSASVFASLLGGPAAGTFAVRPADEHQPAKQEYVGDTFILRTRWRRMKVTDYLDCSGARPTQRAGRTDLIRVIEGKGVAHLEFSPRLDFGRAQTRLTTREGGLEVEGSLDPLVLRSPGITWRIEESGQHHTAYAEVDLSAGPVTLELRFGTGSLRESTTPEAERRRRTDRYWRDWASKLILPARHTEAVRRGALVLRGLCHGPTGAIVAAATTSLPEHIGGVRNWDYRFCWPRDASMAASTLARLGSLREGLAFLDWMLGVMDTCPSVERIAPIYSVSGGRLGPEGEISELPGYAGSRPVRIGNAAAQQVQLDVFGPIVQLVHDLAQRGAPLSSEHWRLVNAMAEAVRHRWREPDHGIWEIRGQRRHHVHTKVMCWLTADRAARISEDVLGRDRPDYRALADEIKADVIENGWNAHARAFLGAYDGCEADASALVVGLSGMLPPDDPRFQGTVDLVERDLRVGPTVYRYRYDDGLPGMEGGFNICTAWLAQAYVLIGRRDDAHALIEALLERAGPTGLIPEEYDPRSGRALGNHPQAYSHLGLIDAVLAMGD